MYTITKISIQNKCKRTGLVNDLVVYLEYLIFVSHHYIPLDWMNHQIQHGSITYTDSQQQLINF